MTVATGGHNLFVFQNKLLCTDIVAVNNITRIEIFHDIYLIQYWYECLFRYAKPITGEGMRDSNQAALLFDESKGGLKREVTGYFLGKKQSDDFSIFGPDFFAHDDFVAYCLLYFLSKINRVVIGYSDIVELFSLDDIFIVRFGDTSIMRAY